MAGWPGQAKNGEWNGTVAIHVALVAGIREYFEGRNRNFIPLTASLVVFAL